MNGSFRWIALETARLQRTTALRPCGGGTEGIRLHRDYPQRAWGQVTGLGANGRKVRTDLDSYRVERRLLIRPIPGVNDRLGSAKRSCSAPPPSSG